MLHRKIANSDQGFTLIELLVVIIIIGVLSAIALPSFLAQGSKARQSEAKVTVGSALKMQQAYRTEESEFTTDWGKLGLGIPKESANYKYELLALKGDNERVDEAVVILALAKNKDLKSYAGGIQIMIQDNNPSFDSILCEAKKPGLPLTKASINMNAERLKCAEEAKRVQ